MNEIVVELSDDTTVGTLRQVARALGQELRIAFEAAPAATAPSTPPPPAAAAAPAPGGDRDRHVAALEANNWNILRTSKALGIARKTLYTRMERWGVKPPKKG